MLRVDDGGIVNGVLAGLVSMEAFLPLPNQPGL